MERYQVRAPSALYRVNFGPDPLSLRGWSAANKCDRLGIETFGYRWDDPQREFRSLYTSASPIGAIIERVQDLQPQQSQLKWLESFRPEPGLRLPAYGVVPADYLENVYLCRMALADGGVFLDVEDSEVLAYLRHEHAALAQDLGQQGFTLAAIFGEDTELTRAIARTAYDYGYAGITATSKLGIPHENWTIFETGHMTAALRSRVLRVVADPLTMESPDLHSALRSLNIVVGPEQDLRYRPARLARVRPPY